MKIKSSQLQAGHVMRSGEIVESVTREERIGVLFVVLKNEEKNSTRTATWGLYSTLFIKG